MFSKKSVKNLSLIIICAAAAVFAAIITHESESSDDWRFSLDFFAMDTVVSVKSQSNITNDIKDIFKNYQNALDRSSKNGEAYILNSKKSITASDTLCRTVRDTLKLNDEYGSLTDITIGRLTSLWNVTSDNPSVPKEAEIKAALETTGTDNIDINGSEITLENGAALDFGAVGKGTALDACLEYLKENNCKKTCISTGSSILLYGGKSKVSISDPDGGVLADVSAVQGFLSTSGGYERFFEADGITYCHIIDPRTGWPAETDLTTVTVFSDSGIESDFLSTMIFLDGSENIEKYLHSDKYKVFAADDNKRLYVSDGLDYEVLNDEYRE